MRKILSLLLCLALVLSLAAPAFAEEGTKSDDIVILYTNDVHTYIGGDMSYDTIAALKSSLLNEYQNVLLLDAGDHIQGTAYGSMDKGKTIIDLMNAAGYDAATLGNHEFDYGMEGTMNVISWAEYPYLSANFYNEQNGVKGERVLDAYQIFDCGSEKIAVVGITTPESFTKSTPAYFQDGNGNYIYGISGGTDGSALAADVQAAIDAAKAEGATKVIGLGHLGDDVSSSPWTSEETIGKVSGLDAFIDGHSHSTVPGKEVAGKDGSKVILTQTGEYFKGIGKMVIDAETGEITTELLTGLSDSDETVKAIQDAWIAEIDTQLGAKIGSTELTLDNYDADGKRLVRSQETNSGDFAADALYYLFDNMDMDVDFAIMNGGGVRNKAITGDLTYKTAKDIHAFGNVACLQTITGQQLLDALEWGARSAGTGEECGGFLQVSGITYEISTDIDSTVQADEKGVWVGGPTGDYRVKNVQVYNKETQAYEPLDLNAKYNLAGYNYTLRDLGDGFAMFESAVNVLDYVMEDYMVLANYIQAFEGSVVGATNSPLLAKFPGLKLDYSTTNGSGRIVLSAAPELPYTDLQEGAYYIDPVIWAVENDITNGTSETTFSPMNTAMRCEALTMLWRAKGSLAPTSTESPFADVEAGAYYYNAVLWAVENGITKGISDTHFGTTAPITRGEFITMLYRSLDDAPKYENPKSLPFTDVAEEDYYYEAILAAYNEGITNGTSATTFSPEAPITRGQVATFLYKYLAKP